MVPLRRPLLTTWRTPLLLCLAAVQNKAAEAANPNRVPKPLFQGTAGVRQGTTGEVPDQWRAFAVGSGSAETTIILLSEHALYAGTCLLACSGEDRVFGTPDDVSVTAVCVEDDDVDRADFGLFQACMTGPFNLQLAPNCLNARLDGDLDVALQDLGVFPGCFCGPRVQANVHCAG